MSSHEFLLVLDPWLNTPEQGRYDELRRGLPTGCEIREYPGESDRIYLHCVREAPRRLDAIAEVVSEIRTRFGLPDADDLGIEKLWEFINDPEFSTDLIAQLLLMAVRRAEFVGLDIEDVVGFLRAATAR